MATMNETFFEALLSPKAAKWSAGVAFDRSNPLPLDQWSVFKDLAAATDYLANAKAYPGQVIAYAEANGEMTVCVLSQNAEGSALTLKPVGVIPTGDGKTIEVSAEGAIALFGAKDAASGTLPMLEEVDGKSKLVWKTLEDIGAGDGNDNTTYEFKFENQKIIITPKENGVAKSNIELDLSAFVTADELNEVVGKAAEGETAATGLYKAIADGIQEAKNYADSNDTDTTYTLTYGDNEDGSKKVIRLVDKANAVISEIDASVFIADGVLNDVSYDADNDKLIFVWNIIEGVDDEGHPVYKTVEVNVKDLVDTYTAGNGLELTEGAFSVKRDASSESFLSVSAEGVKISGIQSAIDAAKQAAIDDASGKYATTGALTQLETDLDARLDVLEAIDHTTYATKSELKATDDVAKDAQSRVGIVEGKIDEITSVGGEPNVVEKIKVNGVTLEVEKDEEGKSTKSVNIPVPTKFSDLTDDSGFDARITAAQSKADDAATAASNAQASADANALVIQANDAAIKLLQGQDQKHTGDITALQQHDRDHEALYNTLNNTVTQHGTDIAGLKSGKADTTATDALAGRITANENGLKALNETTIPGINSEIAKKANIADVYNKTEIGVIAEGKTLVKMIEDAQSAASYDDTKVKEDIQKNATAIEDITKTDGVIDTKVKALAEGAVADNAAAIKTLNETTIPAINKAIEDEAKRADTAEKANATAIAALVGTVEGDNAKSVRNIAKEEVALIVGAAPEAMNTLEEVAKWIADDKSGAAAMAADIKANTDAIAAINNETTGILAVSKEYTNTEIAKLTNSDTGILALAKAHSDANLATAKAHSDANLATAKGYSDTNLAAAKKYSDDAIAALLVKNVDNTTLQLDENGVASVKAVSTDLLVQGETELIFSAGNASGYNTQA